jgi:nitrite reductase (NO-forming)
MRKLACLAVPAWPEKAVSPAPSTELSDRRHVSIVLTLRSGIAEGRMHRRRDISGKVNPTVTVQEGEAVQINLINGEGADN